MSAVGGLKTSRADWGSRQGNSAVSLGSLLNEINALLPLGRGHITANPCPHPNPPPRQRIAADLHQRQHTSPLGLDALRRFARIYQVEGELKGLSDDDRRDQRQRLAKPLWDELRQWLGLERHLVPDGGAAAKAIDYTLGHWAALTRHLQDGAVALDNNHWERQIKPWAMGRKAWQFVGSELAGHRAAIVMSLVQSARMNGHDPRLYLRDVLPRLPRLLNTRLDELLPHRWVSGHA